MCRALELWKANRFEWFGRLQTLRKRFETELLAGIKNCQPVILGQGALRLPTTSNIAFVGLDRQALFLALDQAGVASSTGSACASGSSEASPVLIAMGCDTSVVSGALRFSFGVTTTAEEIEEAAGRITRICNDLGRQKGR
jgi:cysteine desulfurase